jgi:hypothetical protein
MNDTNNVNVGGSDKIEQKEVVSDSNLDYSTTSVNKESNNTDPCGYNDFSNTNTDIVVSSKKELAPIGKSVDLVSVSNELGFTTPLDYISFMVKHSTNSISATGDALLLYQKARELNIGWTTALENIHLLPTKNGTKPTISIHLAKAMAITRSNCIWRKTKDHEPQYHYVRTVGNSKVVYYSKETLPHNYKIFYTSEDYNENVTAKDFIPVLVIHDKGKPVVVDIITEYEFTRKIVVNGQINIMKAKGSFSKSDAIAADLIKPGGSYEKYFYTMLDHRAWMNGARQIIPEVLLGMYLPQEILDENECSINLDENGNPI